jgi:hypothetical protein
MGFPTRIAKTILEKYILNTTLNLLHLPNKQIIHVRDCFIP